MSMEPPILFKIDNIAWHCQCMVQMTMSQTHNINSFLENLSYYYLQKYNINYTMHIHTTCLLSRTMSIECVSYLFVNDDDFTVNLFINFLYYSRTWTWAWA